MYRYVYGNMPGLLMKEGEVVLWHVMALGNQEDLHTPHWHGQVSASNLCAKADCKAVLCTGCDIIRAHLIIVSWV